MTATRARASYAAIALLFALGALPAAAQSISSPSALFQSSLNGAVVRICGLFTGGGQLLASAFLHAARLACHRRGHPDDRQQQRWRRRQLRQLAPELHRLVHHEQADLFRHQRRRHHQLFPRADKQSHGVRSRSRAGGWRSRGRPLRRGRPGAVHGAAEHPAQPASDRRRHQHGHDGRHGVAFFARLRKQLVEGPDGHGHRRRRPRSPTATRAGTSA